VNRLGEGGWSRLCGCLENRFLKNHYFLFASPNQNSVKSFEKLEGELYQLIHKYITGGARGMEKVRLINLILARIKQLRELWDDTQKGLAGT